MFRRFTLGCFTSQCSIDHKSVCRRQHGSSRGVGIRLTIAAALTVATACASPNPHTLKDQVPDAASETRQKDAGVLPDSNSDAPYPVLVASTPVADEVEVYPSPFGDGKAYQFTATLTFSEMMDRSVTAVQLAASDATPTDHEVAWSDDGTTASLVVNPPPLAVQILAEHTTYTLSFGDLQSALGQRVRAVSEIASPYIKFTTGAYDALLNHSCGHTVFGPFGTGVASAIGDAPTFTVTATHTQYALSLPESDEGHAGTVALNLPITGDYRLYFDESLKLAALGSTLDVTRTASSCPGIRAQADIALVAGVPVAIELSSKDSDQVNLIVESLAQNEL
jgi:hypothetical protein